MKMIRQALLCAFSVFVTASVAHAGTSPDATVKEIVDKMKAEGNPAVIVEYVNWEKAFSQFPQQQKDQLNVKSSAELKSFFHEMLANPSGVMRKQMESKLGTVPPEKQEEAKAQIDQIEGMMKRKETELKERLTETTYEVGKPEITGNTATVKLTQSYKDQKKVEDVKLEKDGDRWLLPSVTLASAPPPQQKPADSVGQQPPAAPPAVAPSAAPAPKETPAPKKKK
ncbi:MAG: hypothetical protein U0136_17830 [Bdellovibrionota bacterium]